MRDRGFIGIKFWALALAAAIAAMAVPALGALSEPVSLTFAAQEEGTTPYAYAEALRAEMIKGLPSGSEIEIAKTSPGSVGAVLFINGGQNCDLILSNSAPAKWASEDGIFGYQPTKEVACLAGGLGNDFINIMFTKEFVDRTGIKSVEELIAKRYPVRMIIKRDGTLGELSAEKVFEVLGATFEDVVVWGGAVEKAGTDAIRAGLASGEYDMTIDHVGEGQRMTTELRREREMFDVRMSEETIAKLVDLGYERVTIAPNTWSGQRDAVNTVGSQQCVLVPTSMSEELAYELTKAICEGASEMGNKVAAMKHFDPARAGRASLTGAALHPGAARYYTERGYQTR